MLARLALATTPISAMDFTGIRLVGGATTLCLLVLFRYREAAWRRHGSWPAAAALATYAYAFSLAYRSLPTGAGALLLFGSVQISMVLLSLREGKRLSQREAAGLITAFSGLLWLVLSNNGGNSTGATQWWAVMFMAVSGAAWGYYSILGRQSASPLLDTTGNFLRSTAFVLIVVMTSQATPLFTAAPEPDTHWGNGLWLALASGSITSAIGYALWYSALRGLSATSAAVLQLLVPFIAAIGGLLIVNEPITWQFFTAMAVTLGGILLVVVTPRAFRA